MLSNGGEGDYSRSSADLHSVTHELTASLHSSVATKALSDVGSRLHLSQCLLPFTP